MLPKRGNAFKDLTGRRFGRLVALGYDIRPSGPSQQLKTYWTCKCDCGNTKEISSSSLLSKNAISCGCYHKEMTSKAKTIHGLTHTRIYNIWNKMVDRTKNVKNNEYHNYGARGISVCNKWLTFQNFKEDMYESYLLHVQIHGERNTTIERKDNNLGYNPSNCKWATLIEQGQNKRNSRRYLINGELLTVREISIKYQISINTLKKRIENNFPVDQLIIPPTSRTSRRIKQCC